MYSCCELHPSFNPQAGSIYPLHQSHGPCAQSYYKDRFKENMGVSHYMLKSTVKCWLNTHICYRSIGGKMPIFQSLQSFQNARKDALFIALITWSMPIFLHAGTFDTSRIRIALDLVVTIHGILMYVAHISNLESCS